MLGEEYKWRRISGSIECRDNKGIGALVARVYKNKNKVRSFHLDMPYRRTMIFKSEKNAILYANNILKNS